VQEINEKYSRDRQHKSRQPEERRPPEEDYRYEKYTLPPFRNTSSVSLNRHEAVPLRRRRKPRHLGQLVQFSEGERRDEV